MRASRTALIVLSLSPVVLTATWLLGAFVLNSPWPALCGSVIVFGPLLFLTVSRQIRWRRGVRPVLWGAVCSGGLLVPALALALAPAWLHVRDAGPPAIVLRVDQQFGNDVHVEGLNVRWPPMLRKLPPGGGGTFLIQMSQLGGVTGVLVPARLQDGFGNQIDVSEPQPGILHLEDNAGGFADIDWSAAAPVLVRSRAVVRTEEARGPTPFARRTVGVGQTLLSMTPFVALFLFTLALARQDPSALRLRGALFVQGIGVLLFAVLLALVWTAAGQGGEAGLGWSVLVLLVALPTAGMAMLGAGLLSLALWGMAEALE